MDDDDEEMKDRGKEEDEKEEEEEEEEKEEQEEEVGFHSVLVSKLDDFRGSFEVCHQMAPKSLQNLWLSARRANVQKLRQ